MRTIPSRGPGRAPCAHRASARWGPAANHSLGGGSSDFPPPLTPRSLDFFLSFLCGVPSESRQEGARDLLAQTPHHRVGYVMEAQDNSGAGQELAGRLLG